MGLASIIYRGTTYNQKVDIERLTEIVEEAQQALHKAKYIFPYWRGVSNLTFYSTDVYINVKRKRGTLALYITYKDIGEKVAGFKDLLKNSDSVFPNDLSKEDLLAFQKLIIETAWDDTKRLIKDNRYNVKWAQDREYED